MAWFKTNNPATGGGKITDGGRILCEIAYAINEREHMMGRTETAWRGGLGARPAVNDLTGTKVTLSRLLIEQLRAAIVNLLSYLAPGTAGIVYACDASWNHYTFAALYAEAMGGGTDWAVTDLTGTDVDYGQVFEEMMKCLELLVRWEYYPGYQNGAPYRDDIGDYEEPYILIMGDPSYDTTDAIYAAALAGGVQYGAPSSYPYVYYAVHYTDVGGVDKYTTYVARIVLTEIAKPPSSSPYPTVSELRLKYDILNYTVRADIDLDPWYFRTISAAEFADPAWDGDGTVRDTDSWAGTVTDETKTYATPAWINDGTTYFRFDAGPNNPFNADPNESQETLVFFLKEIRVRQSHSSWTYG